MSLPDSPMGLNTAELKRRERSIYEDGFLSPFHRLGRMSLCRTLHRNIHFGPEQQTEAHGCRGIQKKQRTRAIGRAQMPKCLQASGMIINCRTRGPTDA
jgi:hypothetical protein